MTVFENEEATLACRSGEGDPSPLDPISDIQAENGEDKDGEAELSQRENTEASDLGAEDDTEEKERAEYERLIKGRFKEHFARDTQKIIDRRFKKLKTAEEKLARLEEESARYADIERLIAEERAEAVKETEDRMTRQFRSNRMRAEENALTARSAHPKFDVSSLTRGERAQLATRAQRGEKIHLK